MAEYIENGWIIRTYSQHGYWHFFATSEWYHKSLGGGPYDTETEAYRWAQVSIGWFSG